MQLAPLRRRVEAWARGLVVPGGAAADRRRPRTPTSLDAHRRAALNDPLQDDLLEPPRPTVGQLLREAREDRGLSLTEAERDTRVGRRYLEALEADRFEVLPAPVYARGFLRTYARYLGLDAEEMIALLPAEMPRPVGLEPLPGLRRGTEGNALPAVEPWWIVAGAGVLIVLAVAFLLFGRGGGGGGEGIASPTPDGAASTPAGGADGGTGNGTGAGADDGAGAAPPTVTSTPDDGEAVVPAATVPPFDTGTVPDFTGVEQAEAEALLEDLLLSFLVIELPSAEQPAGRVFGQSPEPGTPIEAGASVTLIVSTGPE